MKVAMPVATPRNGPSGPHETMAASSASGIEMQIDFVQGCYSQVELAGKLMKSFRSTDMIIGKVIVSPQRAGSTVSHAGIQAYLQTHFVDGSDAPMVIKHAWTIAAAGQLSESVEFSLVVPELPELIEAATAVTYTLGCVLQRPSRSRKSAWPSWHSASIKCEERIVIGQLGESGESGESGVGEVSRDALTLSWHGSMDHPLFPLRVPHSIDEASVPADSVLGNSLHWNHAANHSMHNSMPRSMPNSMHGGSMHGSMHSDASLIFSTSPDMIFSTSPDSTIDLPLIISEDEDEEEFEAELGNLSEIALEHNTAVATVLSTVLVGRKVQYRQQPAAMVEAEVVKLSAMPGGNTEAKSGASESPRHGCQLTLRLTDGTLVESSPSHVLPAEEAITAAEGTEMPQPRSHGLNDLAIFIVARSERAALEFRLRAVAFVVSGSWVIMLNCGAMKSKSKFVKASSRSGTLCWGLRHRGKMVRADATPYPELRGATPRDGRSEHLACDGSAERACSFAVLLQYRTIYLLAPNEEEKQMWVAGINTLLSGLYF